MGRNDTGIGGSCRQPVGKPVKLPAHGGPLRGPPVTGEKHDRLLKGAPDRVSARPAKPSAGADDAEVVAHDEKRRREQRRRTNKRDGKAQAQRFGDHAVVTLGDGEGRLGNTRAGPRRTEGAPQRSTRASSSSPERDIAEGVASAAIKRHLCRGGVREGGRNTGGRGAVQHRTGAEGGRGHGNKTVRTAPATPGGCPEHVVRGHAIRHDRAERASLIQRPCSGCQFSPEFKKDLTCGNRVRGDQCRGWSIRCRPCSGGGAPHRRSDAGLTRARAIGAWVAARVLKGGRAKPGADQV